MKIGDPLPLENAKALSAFGRLFDEHLARLVVLRKGAAAPYSDQIRACLSTGMALIGEHTPTAADADEFAIASPITRWIADRRDALVPTFEKIWDYYARENLDIAEVGPAEAGAMGLEREIRFWGLLVPIIACRTRHDVRPDAKLTKAAIEKFMKAAKMLGEAATLMRADPRLERSLSNQEIPLLNALPEMMAGFRETFDLICLENLYPPRLGRETDAGAWMMTEIAEVFYRSFGHCSVTALEIVMRWPDVLLAVPYDRDKRLGEKIAEARQKVALSDKRRSIHDFRFPSHQEDSLHYPSSRLSPWLGVSFRSRVRHSIAARDDEKINKEFFK